MDGLSQKAKDLFSLYVVKPLFEGDDEVLAERVLNTSIRGEAHSIYRVVDAIYRSKELDCYSILKNQLGMIFLKDNKFEIFSFVQSRLITARPFTPTETKTKTKEEENMSINTDVTKILDLPIIVFGVDVRGRSSETLLGLLSRLNEAESKYKSLGSESLHIKSAISKIAQAKKAVIRELDKTEP